MFAPELLAAFLVDVTNTRTFIYDIVIAKSLTRKDTDHETLSDSKDCASVIAGDIRVDITFSNTLIYYTPLHGLEERSVDFRALLKENIVTIDGKRMKMFVQHSNGPVMYGGDGEMYLLESTVVESQPVNGGKLTYYEVTPLHQDWISTFRAKSQHTCERAIFQALDFYLLPPLISVVVSYCFFPSSCFFMTPNHTPVSF